MLLSCLFQLPKSFSFSLLLSAENDIFPDHHSELGSPGPSLGCTLVTPMALEPGVGPITSRLPIWLLSWINCFNYKAVLPKYADSTLYACFSSFPLPPAPSHLTPPPPPGHLRSSFFIPSGVHLILKCLQCIMLFAEIVYGLFLSVFSFFQWYFSWLQPILLKCRWLL